MYRRILEFFKPRILYIVLPVVIALAFFFGFLGVRNLLDRPGAHVNDADYEMYDGQTVRLVIGSRLLSLRHPPIVRDNEIAIDFDTVKRYIDKTVHIDPSSKRVTVTTRDRLVRMNTDNLTALVNDRREVSLDLPVFEENGVVYLPMKFLSEFFQIRVTHDADTNVVMVDDRKTVIQTATIVEKGAVMRLGRSLDDPVVKRYPNPDAKKASAGLAPDSLANAGGEPGGGEEGLEGDAYGTGDASDFDGADAMYEDDGLFDGFDMYVFEEYEGWYRARSLDGIIGFIEKKFIAVTRRVDRLALTEPRQAWAPENGKIVMVWEQVHTQRGNPDVSAIPDMPGLDVVSPTWFHLTGKDGAIESRASAEYIEWARRNGYRIWPLFANKMDDIDMTSAFLNDGEARENAIRAILAYASMLGVEGINLDFENIYLRDRDALTQFVREMAPMLREQGLTFTVDVNVPDGSDTWSKCYDTPAIAEAADYIVLMAYDQHWASSPIAGSVSQLSWVEANLNKLIERDGVRADRIILGIPFYTRVWEMENAAALPGDRPVNSSAVGMRTAIGAVFDNGAEVEWDGVSGQFFASYIKENKPFHVWLEEPHSVNMRVSLVHKYALAGVSAWSRNFAIPEIWDVLDYGLKEIMTYYQWLAEAFAEAPALAPVRN